MAIEKIIPDGSSAVPADWSSNPHLALDADDTNFASCSQPGKKMTIHFSDLTSNIGSINSIRFYINGFDSQVRGASDICYFDLANASDASYSLSENKTFTDASGLTVQAGTERTTYDGSNAWTVSLVNGIRIIVGTVNIHPGGTVELDHLYINVDYNPAGTATYDTTVNNTHITSGNMNVSSGNIFI